MSKIYKFNKIIHYPIGLLFFLILLTAGADLVNVRIFGLTFRLVTLFSCVGIILLLINYRNIYVHKITIYNLIGLVLTSLISLYFSYDIFRTAAYTLWLIFIAIILFPYIYTIAIKIDKRLAIKYWIVANKIQAILLVMEAIIMMLNGEFGFNERPHLWFYEPSYAAIYFSAYFSFSLYMIISYKFKFRWDLALASTTLLILTSATGIVAIIISVLVVASLTGKLIQLGSIFILIFFLIFYIMQNFYSDNFAYQLMFGFILNNVEGYYEAFLSILNRAGNRPARFLSGWEAFLAHPLYGIGFGADSTYNTINSLNNYAFADMSSVEIIIENNPFINPFIEMFGTMGILGGTIFIIFISTLIFNIRKNYVSSDCPVEVKALVSGLIVMFLTLQIEGTVLRFYLWTLCALVVGVLSNTKKRDAYINND